MDDLKAYLPINLASIVILASSANAWQRAESPVSRHVSNHVHQIRIIGAESARPNSNSPFMLGAIDAEAGGRMNRCSNEDKVLRHAGGGAVYKYKDRYLVITTAHTLYKDGKPKCGKNYVLIGPDRHYDNHATNKRHRIDYKKRYKLKFPPLNHKEASQANRKRRAKKSYVDDFAVLAIKDPSLLKSQVRGSDGKFRKRQFLELLDISSDELLEWSKTNPIRIIGDRKNYLKRRKVVIETKKNCIKPRKRSKLMMHCLDTGSGTSGRPIRTGRNGVIGIHVGGSVKATTDADFFKTSRGNSFIPSWYILEKLRRLEADGRL